MFNISSTKRNSVFHDFFKNRWPRLFVMWRVNSGLCAIWRLNTGPSVRTLFPGRAQHTLIANISPTEASSKPKISKDVLLKMRKQTGYSYVKCRKALLACGGEQNYEQALRWIREAAIKEGWDKAAKLSTRIATQGLCGLATINNNISIIVELNCETDFVARSAVFKQLIGELVKALSKHADHLSPVLNDDASHLNMLDIEPNKLHMDDGRTAEEAIVATIGRIGENIRLRRASIVFTRPSNSLFGQTHPKGDQLDGVQLGRFVSLVALARKEDNSGFPSVQLGQQLCQHIIGMAPDSLGTAKKRENPKTEKAMPTDDKNDNNWPEREAKSESSKAESGDDNDDELNASQVDQSELTRLDGDETRLLQQAFMLNPEQTIGNYLEYHGASIADFVRIELGQEQITKGIS